MQKVKEVRMLLARNPRLGSVEPLLDDHQEEYRSVVVTRQNKMVYRIMDDCIEIADFWDCRREPELQAENMRENKQRKDN